MDKKLDEVLIRLAILEKRLESVEKKLNIVQGVDSSVLFDALQLLLTTDQISTTLLHKRLSITAKDAITLYEKLEHLGLIKTVEINRNDPTQPFKVGLSRKYKVKKYLESGKQ